MTTALFELGEHGVAGPTYDLDAAANFYIPMRNKVAALGLGDLSLRLGRMAEIDAQVVEEARRSGCAPVFLTPDAYPIEGEAPKILSAVSLVRRLITRPSEKRLHFGPVNNIEGSDEDKAVMKQVEEFEQLLVHPEYQPLGYVEPDLDTIHWYMPSVIDGIAIQKREVKFDGNQGRYEVRDGEHIPMPFHPYRQIGLTAFRTRSTTAR